MVLPQTEKISFKLLSALLSNNVQI